MQYSITYHHVKPSEALEQYAKEKVGRTIAKLGHKPIEARITVEANGPSKEVRCHLMGGDGVDVDARQTNPDLYVAVDLMTSKLARQLKRRKEKLQDHQESRFIHHNQRLLA